MTRKLGDVQIFYEKNVHCRFFIKKTEKEISDIKVRYLGKFEEDDFAIKDVREHLKITNGIKGGK